MRHPEIPWNKIAGIGNILRHAYDHVAPDILWKLLKDDLPALKATCLEESAKTEPDDPSGVKPD